MKKPPSSANGAPAEVDAKTKEEAKEIRNKRRIALAEEAALRRAKEDEEELEAIREKEKQEERAWLQVMDESVGRVFQPRWVQGCIRVVRRSC